MRASIVFLASLSLAAAGAAVAAEPPTSAPARGFDLSTRGPSEAVQAAKAVKPQTPGVAPPADTVRSITVTPETPQQGRVIASSDAAPLASPDFTAGDAEDAPLAVKIGDNAALGRKVVDNPPPPGGLLRTNPDLIGDPLRGEVGVTALFH
jgi:hypothetical protein